MIEKQLEQLLQLWTTLRGDIASSRSMLTKACCKGNNYEQRFALDTFPADFSWRNVLAKPCFLLFTLQQDCNTREACRLLLVVKVVFVVFPNSAGRIANSTNPITRFSGWTPFMWFYIQNLILFDPKIHWEAVTFSIFIPENWHKWQKSGMYSMCWSCSMKMNMAATHGCNTWHNTEQTIATRSVSDSSYTRPFAGEQEPKMW